MRAVEKRRLVNDDVVLVNAILLLYEGLYSFINLKKTGLTSLLLVLLKIVTTKGLPSV